MHTKHHPVCPTRPDLCQDLCKPHFGSSPSPLPCSSITSGEIIELICVENSKHTATMAALASPYPRPDFQRTDLRWNSLNGSWDFLFDDNDQGLSQAWQRQSLPSQVIVSNVQNTGPAQGSQADSITQRIAAGTQDLIANNVFARSGVTTHSKRNITVPYVFQSPASGINERDEHEVLWYERTITDLRSVHEKQQEDRALLRFGAVDYEATVWVDGHLVGAHRGGHVPFDVDITSALDASPSSTHRVTVRVFDSAHDLTQPRGKQYWMAKPESIFYTPSGGIWQSVWQETVPAARVADSSNGTVIRSHDIHAGELHSIIQLAGRRAGQKGSVEIEARFAGLLVSKSARTQLSNEVDWVAIDQSMRLSDDLKTQLPSAITQAAPWANDRCWRDGVALWTPEHPQLYDLTIRLYDGSGSLLDEVNTSTGMRSISWKKGDGVWRLNDRPYFQALCLDQGYWPDTFMTPPSADALKEDIILAKRMGLNGCRKHQKVEDPIFYYWADRLGYLVWGEMASAYQFSQEYVERFNQEWTEAVKLVINRPSVVTWTTVNESWGYTSLKDNTQQRDHIRALYYLTKYVFPNARRDAANNSRSMDPTRSINDNCGWEHVLTDLSTFHDYSDGPELERTCADFTRIFSQKAERDMFVPAITGVDPGSKHQEGAPIMCTEFGGVNIAPEASDARDRDWGYTTATDPEDLLKRLERLMKGITAGGHCCAFVYTQL